MKTPDPTKAESSAQNSAKFTGTDNPRHLRVIHVLTNRPLVRHELDNVAGCANGPELVAELRRRGLDLPCTLVPFVDRDGRPCRPGVYSLSSKDRRRIYAWMAKLGKGKHG